MAKRRCGSNSRYREISRGEVGLLSVPSHHMCSSVAGETMTYLSNSITITLPTSYTFKARFSPFNTPCTEHYCHQVL